MNDGAAYVIPSVAPAVSKSQTVPRAATVVATTEIPPSRTIITPASSLVSWLSLWLMVEIVPCLTDPSKRTQTRASAFGSHMTATLPLRIHSVPIRINLQYRIVVSFPCSVRKRGRSRSYTAGAVRPIPGSICNYRIVLPFCRRRKSQWTMKVEVGNSTAA